MLLVVSTSDPNVWLSDLGRAPNLALESTKKDQVYHAHRRMTTRTGLECFGSVLDRLDPKAPQPFIPE